MIPPHVMTNLLAFPILLRELTNTRSSMYDATVFAVLTAYGEKKLARDAFGLPENAERVVKRTRFTEVRGPSSRESTPGDWQPGFLILDTEPRLIIDFDVKNHLHGVQFGRDPSTSDVLLGRVDAPGISRRQYNIIVDDDLSIRLQDLHSKYGTAVGCDGQNETEWRKWETWILAPPPGEGSPFSSVTIHSAGLAVEIEFPNHAAASAEYVENLRAFAKKRQEALARHEEEITTTVRLGFEGALTIARPVTAETPRDRLVYYDDKIIGQSTLGSVLGVIRMRDGKYFAAKTFPPPSNKRKRDGVELSWLIDLRREFTIMKDNSHVSTSWVYSSTTVLTMIE